MTIILTRNDYEQWCKENSEKIDHLKKDIEAICEEYQIWIIGTCNSECILGEIGFSPVKIDNGWDRTPLPNWDCDF
jgi:hypothetical protein